MNIPSASSGDTALASLGKLTLSLFSYLLLLFSKGWAISTLWNWFIAAPFNAPKLGVASAIGVAFVYSIIALDGPRRIKEVRADKAEWAADVTNQMAAALVMYPISVGLGWIVRSFL